MNAAGKPSRKAVLVGGCPELRVSFRAGKGGMGGIGSPFSVPPACNRIGGGNDVVGLFRCMGLCRFHLGGKNRLMGSTPEGEEMNRCYICKVDKVDAELLYVDVYIEGALGGVSFAICREPSCWKDVAKLSVNLQVSPSLNVEISRKPPAEGTPTSTGALLPVTAANYTIPGLFWKVIKEEEHEHQR